MQSGQGDLAAIQTPLLVPWLRFEFHTGRGGLNQWRENVSKHPIQPVAKDEHGVLRFKPNAIVSYLLEHGGLDMNKLACIAFSQDDQQHFAQLIGYSLSGYGDLSYADADVYNAAETMIDEGLTEDKARIAALETELTALRSALREPMARLFGMHPDDLRQ